LFWLANCGIDRLETIILEALFLITQSKMYADVALDSNIEKRSSFRSGLRNEELMWVYPGNKSGASSTALRLRFPSEAYTRFSYRWSSRRTVRALDIILNRVDARAFKQTTHFYGNLVVDREIKGLCSCSR
jgi:hypothetical protein